MDNDHASYRDLAGAVLLILAAVGAGFRWLIMRADTKERGMLDTFAASQKTMCDTFAASQDANRAMHAGQFEELLSELKGVKVRLDKLDRGCPLLQQQQRPIDVAAGDTVPAILRASLPADKPEQE